MKWILDSCRCSMCSMLLFPQWIVYFTSILLFYQAIFNLSIKVSDNVNYSCMFLCKLLAAFL